MIYVPAWFYILRLTSGLLYCGATRNLEERVNAHKERKACRTTRFDPSIGIAYQEEYSTLGEARSRENQVKRWSRAKKEALIRGDLRALKALSRCRKSRR